MIRKAILLLLLGVFAALAVAQTAQPAASAEERANPREEELYKQATGYLNDAAWDRAVTVFTNIANLKGRRADASFYWKAYALNKMGRSSAALATIDRLRTNYPHSTWLKDAGALEIEIKRASGQTVNPRSQEDEDLQLLALNSLMDRNCGTAVPQLQGVLSSNKSDKVKERALYVLVQHDCPNSHEALLALAKGSSSPALQAKAVDFLGSLGGVDNLKTLAEIYKGSDTPVKRRVLHAFQNLGAKNELLSTVSTEKDPDLRRYAVQGLANLGATSELRQLYASSQTTEEKKDILHNLANLGDIEGLQLAAKETDPSLRIEMVHSLADLGAKGQLRKMYDSAASVDEKRQILHSLANLGDSEGLRQLAQGTSDPVLRKELIHDLGNLGARNELLTMYSGKSSLDEKKEILHGLMNLGDTVDLEKFASDPSDPDIRAEAIRGLANSGSAAPPVLTRLYANETNADIKKSIIHALYNNNDAHDLVAIARKEADPGVRRYAIDQLSRMNDKEAQDFLIEMLNK